MDGVHNFRDYGGYALQGGGRLRRGVLWRSGQHHEASDADLALIEGPDLAHVFDLRSDRERESHPCRRPQGFVAKIHFIPDGTAGQAPHVSSARRDAASTREAMRRSYSGMPYREKLNAAISAYLRTLAEEPGPSVVNCMAGKDRTGFAVAMFHHALGVHRDDILADYLLTNLAAGQDERIAAGKWAIAGMVGDIDDESFKVLMGVEAEYLDLALSRIVEDFGSIDAYQQQTFGITNVMRDRLRDALSEG